MNRYVSMFAGVVAACVLSAGCALSSPATRPAVSSASSAAITAPSATLVVHGMSCPLCAHNVDKQLLAVPGVTKVELDMGQGHARIALDGTGRTTRENLAEAIDRSGFTLVEVRVP